MIHIYAAAVMCMAMQVNWMMWPMCWVERGGDGWRWNGLRRGKGMG